MTRKQRRSRSEHQEINKKQKREELENGVEAEANTEKYY